MFLQLISSITSIVTSLLGITAIVVFHEFGHFIFCKLFNVYTPTFSIGMGKILFSKKIGQTNFCLSAAPIGGYVEIASEEGIKGTKGFSQIPYYQKFFIMLGGILCNFLLAFFIFAGLFFTDMPESGLPYQTNKTTISAIDDNSINFHLIKPSDTITSINQKQVLDDASIIKNEISKKIDAKENQIITTIQRDNTSQEVLLNIKTDQTSLNKILDLTFEKKSSLGLKASFYQAYETTKFCINSNIRGIKTLFSSSAGKGLVGPIMTIAISSKSAQKGFSNLLLLLAIISVSLGFMNLLPLPIFDGGQFVLFTIEAITGKRLSEQVQNIIGTVSWILAIGLMVIFSIKDLYSIIIG